MHVQSSRRQLTCFKNSGHCRHRQLWEIAAWACRCSSISRTWSSLIRAQSISSQTPLVQEEHSLDSSLSANFTASVIQLAWTDDTAASRSGLPFLIFKYQIGPDIFTIVLVTHSRSESGTRHTFRVIWAERVGNGDKRCRNAGRKGRMSLG